MRLPRILLKYQLTDGIRCYKSDMLSVVFFVSKVFDAMYHLRHCELSCGVYLGG